jgi:hypothetical protein
MYAFPEPIPPIFAFLTLSVAVSFGAPPRVSETGATRSDWALKPWALAVVVVLGSALFLSLLTSYFSSPPEDSVDHPLGWGLILFISFLVAAAAVELWRFIVMRRQTSYVSG